MNAIDIVNMLPTAEKKKILAMLQNEVGQQDGPKESITPIPQAAKRINRSKRTVNSLIKDGILVPFIPRGRVRAWGVTASSLESFLATGGKAGAE